MKSYHQGYDDRNNAPSNSYRGILVYIICLISISNSVSDGASNKSVLNTINSASEYEPDVLITFCATRV